jgi:hypothetical protein
MFRLIRPRTLPLAAALGFAAAVLAPPGAFAQLTYTGGIPQMLIIGPIDIGPDAGPACDDRGRLAGADYLAGGALAESNVLARLGDEIAPQFGGLSAGLGVKLVASTAINPRRSEGILTVWKAAADIEGAINFDAGPAKGDGLVLYAVAYLENLTAECLEVVLEVASDDAVKVRLNGQLLGVSSGCRTLAGWGDGDRFPAVLGPGANIVLLAVVDGAGPNAVRLVLRQADGSPIRDGSVLPGIDPPPSYPSAPAAITRAIAPGPYGPGPVSVTLTASGIARPTTLTEEFPPGWAVSDAGGGTVEAPGRLRFDIAADGVMSYALVAPRALNVQFEGRFDVFPCEGQPQSLLVGGSRRLERIPPGDLPITGGSGRDIGAVPIPGGQEEVTVSPIAFNVFASGTDFGGTTDQGRMVVLSQGATAFDARCTVAAIDPIDPLTRGGLMVRAACDAGSPAAAGSPFAFVAATAALGAMFQFRDAQGATAQSIEIPTRDGESYHQVRLVRRGGDRIEAFARADGGTDWRLIAVKDLPGLESCLGAALTARHPAASPRLAGAEFVDVSISTDPLPPAVAAAADFSCRISGRDVELSFTPPAGAASIEVARGSAVLALLDGGAAAYLDPGGARAGADLAYTVTARDPAGLPGPSASCTVFTCRDGPDAPTASLVWAFDFGAYAIDCPTAGDPSRKFIVLHQSKDRDTAVADSFAYDAARGYGFEVFWKNPADLALPNPYGDRGGTAVLWGRYGPFDDTLNNRASFAANCLEQVYNSFVGAKNFGAFNLIDPSSPALGSYPCDEAIAGNRIDPCTPDTILPNGQPYTPEGLVFRMDVPNGAYRFAAAFGDELVHAHRVLAEDGGSGPPASIGPNHVTLVHNFDQAQHAGGETVKNGKPGANVYARVGFDGKLPPPGDGLKPSPVFVNMDRDGKETAGCPESPVLNVTQGAIRIHLLQANSNNGPGGTRDPQGPDMVVLEAWRVEPCPAAGDTHCDGLAVSGPPGNLRGNFLITASAVDEAGDPITYTFEARKPGVPPIVYGPQPENTAMFDLTEGSWTISVATDDDSSCPDRAADADASMEVTVVCPEDGDTHCRGLTVAGPSGENGLNPGTFVASATAEDDTGDPISYLFTVSGGGGAPQVFGPQPSSQAQFDLAEGTWVIRVEVDDTAGCLDVAADASCEKTVRVVPPCPAAGDTHCRGIEVTGPPLGAPGTYTVKATAGDDSNDPISYLFTASDGVGSPRVAGPQPGNQADFELSPGDWTISVEVDDDRECSDRAADNRCSTALKVEIPGGRVVPGDCNADGTLDISDAICIIGALFLGNPPLFPCGDGLPGHAANLQLLDFQPDGGVDISDALAAINFLFLGGPAHALAIPGQAARGCVRVIDCHDACQ